MIAKLYTHSADTSHVSGHQLSKICSPFWLCVDWSLCRLSGAGQVVCQSCFSLEAAGFMRTVGLTTTVNVRQKQ